MGGRGTGSLTSGSVSARASRLSSDLQRIVDKVNTAIGDGKFVSPRDIDMAAAADELILALSLPRNGDVASIAGTPEYERLRSIYGNSMFGPRDAWDEMQVVQGNRQSRGVPLGMSRADYESHIDEVYDLYGELRMKGINYGPYAVAAMLTYDKYLRSYGVVK